jgi:DNA-binding NtrC family response regulator
MARRQAAICRLLDHWLQLRNSVLRTEDLTEANLQALLRHDWPGNLTGLREAAVRLDVIASAGLSRTQAAEAEELKITRQGLDFWYNEAMCFEKQLVSPSAKRRILAALAARKRSTNEGA